MATLQDLITVAEKIKTETTKGANSALRVGGLLKDHLEFLKDHLDGDFNHLKSQIIEITYDAGEDVDDPNPISMLAGHTMNELPVVEKSGYHFDGWFLDPQEEEISHTEFTTETVVEKGDDFTLYAHWTPEIVINFDLQGGEGTAEDTVVLLGETVEEGDMPDDPTKSGYTFDGWFYEPDGATEPTEFETPKEIEEEGDFTLYAHWTEEE